MYKNWHIRIPCFIFSHEDPKRIKQDICFCVMAKTDFEAILKVEQALVKAVSDIEWRPDE